MIFPRRRGGRRHPRRQPGRHLPSTVTVAVLCEVLALVLSVGANLAAVWGDGTLAIVAAGAIPFVLIGATYLFLGDRLAVAWRVPRRARPARGDRPARERQPGAEGWAAWWANLASAALILVPVASASYWHQRELLLATNAPTWIATLLPLAVDGLALRAALTLFRLAHQPAATAATPGASDATTGTSGGDEDDVDELEDADDDLEDLDGVDEPEPAPLPVLDGIDPDVVAAAAALIADNPLIGRPALRDTLGVRDSPARRLLRELRPMRPVEGGEAA